MAEPVKTRPGGRSARVRSAVLAATVEELVAVGNASFSIEGVAERAGVNKTTVYRRWANRENLLLEAILGHGRDVPLPDTGSLRSDLLAYGNAIVASVQDPELEAMARAIVSVGDPESPIAKASRAFWAKQFDLGGVIVDRAIERNEIPPGADSRAVLEAIIAPIFFRLLLSRDNLDRRFIQHLAESAASVASAPTRRTSRLRR